VAKEGTCLLKKDMETQAARHKLQVDALNEQVRKILVVCKTNKFAKVYFATSCEAASLGIASIILIFRKHSHIFFRFQISALRREYANTQHDLAMERILVNEVQKERDMLLSQVIYKYM
jgi:hypothetical protein